MPDSRPAGTGHRYEIYGLVIESDVRLQSIEEAPPSRVVPALTIAQQPRGFFAEAAARLVSDIDDHVQYVVLADGGIYIHVDTVFEAIVSVDGRRVACSRLGDVEPRSYEAHLLNFVIAAALTLQGEEPMHATVVAFEGRAAGLLGQSGAGKSTLAASLIAHGGELLTDDMLRLTFRDGLPIVETGPNRLKLFDEPAQYFLPRAAKDGHFNALSGKTMVRPGPVAASQRQARPLVALFWLSERPPMSDKVELRKLAGIELAKVLLSSTMNNRYQAVDRLARQLAFDERLAKLVPVYELVYPRTFAALDPVYDEIRSRIAA